LVYCYPAFKIGRAIGTSCLDCWSGCNFIGNLYLFYFNDFSGFWLSIFNYSTFNLLSTIISSLLGLKLLAF